MDTLAAEPLAALGVHIRNTVWRSLKKANQP